MELNVDDRCSAGTLKAKRRPLLLDPSLLPGREPTIQDNQSDQAELGEICNEPTRKPLVQDKLTLNNFRRSTQKSAQAGNGGQILDQMLLACKVVILHCVRLYHFSRAELLTAKYILQKQHALLLQKTADLESEQLERDLDRKELEAMQVLAANNAREIESLREDKKGLSAEITSLETHQQVWILSAILTRLIYLPRSTRFIFPCF